jgi:hypothetical protein
MYIHIIFGGSFSSNENAIQSPRQQRFYSDCGISEAVSLSEIWLRCVVRQRMPTDWLSDQECARTTFKFRKAALDSRKKVENQNSKDMPVPSAASWCSGRCQPWLVRIWTVVCLSCCWRRIDWQWPQWINIQLKCSDFGALFKASEQNAFVLFLWRATWTCLVHIFIDRLGRSVLPGVLLWIVCLIQVNLAIKDVEEGITGLLWFPDSTFLLGLKADSSLLPQHVWLTVA